MARAKRVIIFDFDGTIADSFELFTNTLYLLTGIERFSPEEEESFRSLSGLQLAKVIGVRPWKIPFLISRSRTIGAQHIDEILPFDGMEAVLRTLHKQGHTMVIASTNKTETIETFLHKHHMRSYFTQVYGDIGFFSKARVLRKIMRDHGLKADTCIYIGDELRDIHACRRAKLRCVAVTWGYNSKNILDVSEAFAVVDRPKDLVAILQ